MLVTDPKGNERSRLEGYLPKDEFRVSLEMALARVAVMRKDWADAERRYKSVVENSPDSQFAPEAVYWRGVSRYKATNDHEALGEVAKIFGQKYRDSIQALKSQPWQH